MRGSEDAAIKILASTYYEREFVLIVEDSMLLLDRVSTTSTTQSETVPGALPEQGSLVQRTLGSTVERPVHCKATL